MYAIITATAASQHALLSPPTSDYLPLPTSAPFPTFLSYFDSVSFASVDYRIVAPYLWLYL